MGVYTEEEDKVSVNKAFKTAIAECKNNCHSLANYYISIICYGDWYLKLHLTII